jgi:hypothetical protein
MEAVLDTKAMLNGFAVRRFWWNDDQARADAGKILNNTAHHSTLNSLLGERLLGLLRESR